MTIERLTPEVDYLDVDMMKSIGVSHMVKANGFIHFSGIVAARGQSECVSPGDAEAQVRSVLSTLDKLLRTQSLDWSDLVSTTIYVTDMAALVPHSALFAQAYGNHHPASTWIGVQTLAAPDFLLEMVAIAALRSQ